MLEYCEVARVIIELFSSNETRDLNHWTRPRLWSRLVTALSAEPMPLKHLIYLHSAIAKQYISAKALSWALQRTYSLVFECIYADTNNMMRYLCAKWLFRSLFFESNRLQGNYWICKTRENAVCWSATGLLASLLISFRRPKAGWVLDLFLSWILLLAQQAAFKQWNSHEFSVKLQNGTSREGNYFVSYRQWARRALKTQNDALTRHKNTPARVSPGSKAEAEKLRLYRTTSWIS